MKMVIYAALLSSFLAISASARANKVMKVDDAAILATCPTSGDAKTARAKSLNTLKRRMTTPSATDIDSHVSLSSLAAPGDDTTRFEMNKAATIEGYVADVKVGGIESANCHTRDAKYRDTHIEFTLDPLRDSENKHVIVEVTPQWREKMANDGKDWSTLTLRKTLLGKRIKVTGWLLFDIEHVSNAVNTNPGGAKNWRATVWEVHPITDIQLLSGKPN